MKMVRSDLAASGIMFSLDTETGFRDVVLVSAAYDGRKRRSGVVDPDEFMVFKPTFEQGNRSVLRRTLAARRSRWCTSRAGRAKPRATCDTAGGAGPLLHHGRGRPHPGRLRRQDRAPLQPEGGRPVPWTWNGRRTASTSSSTWCRPARDRGLEQAGQLHRGILAAGSGAIRSRPLGGHAHRLRDGALIPNVSQIGQFKPGESWSPTPRRPTGNPS